MILGIDPGAHGAFALYDPATGKLGGEIIDMPTWQQTVGRTKRTRIDPIALAEFFDTLPILGVDFIVMEAVGGYGKQPGSAGFQFGYGVGLVAMCCVYARIPYETVIPSVWKQMLKVPGKKKASDDEIMQRACQMFAGDSAQFFGPQGGKKVDRAEAAMIARYGGEFLYPHMKKSIDFETLVRNADTGA